MNAVDSAYARARADGFGQSCDPAVGSLLAATAEGFDPIFADAFGGKIDGLDRTTGKLNPRGTLIVDDMTPVEGWPADFRAEQAGVRRALLEDPGLVTAELAHGSGVIIGVRRPPAG